MDKITITGKDLTFEDVVKVAYQTAKVELGDLEKVRQSVEFINKKVDENEVIYGVTTGFGSNADKVIKKEDAKKLQINLLRSHSAGVGKNFPKHIVRAIMLIRLNTLLKGYSGVREETLNLLRDFLNYGVHPVIPEQGSVGASGDLCPLSHMALALIGEGYVEYNDAEMKTEEFFELPEIKKLKLKPVELSYKEGLGLNNGTTVMAALGVFAVYDFERLLKLATLSSCLMFEALCVRREAFEEIIHKVRNNKAQIEVAKWIRKFTKGSTFVGIKSDELKKFAPTDDEKRKLLEFEIKKSNLNEGESLSDAEEAEYEKLKEKQKIGELADKKKIPQDSYSIRCAPQVFGASLQALWHVKEVIANEINAAVDNPLIFVEENKVLSGGNFHGQPVALVLDYLKLAIAEVGNITERQIAKLVDKNTNDGLPSFLIENKDGTNSGLMIPQYAAAGLVSENKVLVHPASADSIPTCENTEDHVSMGPIAGRQALEILENVKKILSIALLAGHHAAAIRQKQFENIGIPAQMAEATKSLFETIKETIPDFKKDEFLEKDRFLYDDIKQILDNYKEFSAMADSLI